MHSSRGSGGGGDLGVPPEATDDPPAVNPRADRGPHSPVVALVLASANTDEAEEGVLSFLLAGRYPEARLAGRDSADETLPLVARLAAADCAARAGRSEFSTLERLAAALRTGDDPRGWRHWLAAIHAEHFLWRGDFTALAVAVAAHCEFAGEPEGPLTRLARARLRRIAAFASLYGHESQRETAEALRAEALADLRALDAREEELVTEGLFTFIDLLHNFESTEAGTARLESIAQGLDGLDSDRAGIAWFGLGFLALYLGDLDSARSCGARCGAAMPRLPPPLASMIDILMATCDLCESGSDDAVLDRLLRAADDMSVGVAQGAGLLLGVASFLLDHGLAAAAARVIRGSAQNVSVTLQGSLDLREVAGRLRGAESPSPENVAVLTEALQARSLSGSPRRAGWAALRAARTCEYAGLPAEAARLREWGRGFLPGDEDAWLSVERWAVEPVPVARRARVLRLLSPDVILERPGHLQRLPDMAARLAALLVAEQRPLTVDRVVDFLWPEADMVTGKNRLGVLVHRIRRQCGLEKDELFVRDDNAVRLEPGSRWSVDVWEFLDLSQGSAPDRLLALQRYSSPFAARQLAYEDELDDVRERLQGRWKELAGAALRAGEVDRWWLLDRAAALGVDLGSDATG